ncbi:MAG TPA: hypothetical protein VFX33_01185 [Actinomycetales bacterium]|nr:hypothetical protein [Actinomycetales bacterium]
MYKRAIVDWCAWGLAAFVPGFILVFSTSLTLLARQQQHGSSDQYGRTMLALLTSGLIFLLAAAVLELVAWVLAVRHASRLEESRWTTALLWGGIVGMLTIPLFGVGVMIFGSVMTAYLVVAPNRPSAHPRMAIPPKPVILRWGTRGWSVAGAGMLLALAVPNLLTNPGRPLHGAIWPSLALVGAFWAAGAIGAVMVGAAWWGAVFNSFELADKTWFRRLRWTGIVGVLTLPLFGLGTLILFPVFVAYARHAPDGVTAGPQRVVEKPVSA